MVSPNQCASEAWKAHPFLRFGLLIAIAQAVKAFDSLVGTTKKPRRKGVNQPRMQSPGVPVQTNTESHSPEGLRNRRCSFSSNNLLPGGS